MTRRYVSGLLAELMAVFRIGGMACLLEFVGLLIMHAHQVFRTRSLAVVDQAMGPRARSFRVSGETIRLEGPVFGGAREIYGRQVYFATAGFDLKPNDVVVDLGANVGVFTILAAKRCARVVALEAQSRFVDEINHNASLNECAERISVELGIIGGDSGLFSDMQHLEAASHYSVHPPHLTMGELLRRNAVDRIDFLKVDIEGSEFGLFADDLAWLRCVRRIAMEVHCEFGDPVALARCLAAHDFAVLLMDNSGATVDKIIERSGYLFAKRY